MTAVGDFGARRADRTTTMVGLFSQGHSVEYPSGATSTASVIRASDWIASFYTMDLLSVGFYGGSLRMQYRTPIADAQDFIRRSRHGVFTFALQPGARRAVSKRVEEQST